MRAYLKSCSNGTVIIDIEGENHAEQVLLSHLSEGHKAIACVGPYGDGLSEGKGMRFLVMNKTDEPVRKRRRR